MTHLTLDAITIDADIQQRAAFSDALVAEYAENVLQWIESAPITVFQDGETHWLADGFHRIAAIGEQPYFLKENMDVHGFPVKRKKENRTLASAANPSDTAGITAQQSASNGAA